MPLESAGLIHQLEVSNPSATDPLSQTDDHIRLVKSCLKSTFPSVTGAVTATHEQLNDTVQLRADVDDLASKKLDKTGGTLTGALTVTGNLNVTGKLQEAGTALLPVGIILMWSGNAASVPAGWAICNGQTVNGIATPDLRNRFIVGAGNSYAQGSVGGATSQTVTSTAAGGHSHAGSTSNAGSHNHGGKTGGRALTVAQMPPHAHETNSLVKVEEAPANRGSSSGGGATYKKVTTNSQGGGEAHDHDIGFDGAHTHTVTVAAVGDHAHSSTVATVPPYVALFYIMRVA